MEHRRASASLAPQPRRSTASEPAPAVDTTTRSRLALPGFTLHPACLAWLLAALRPAGPYPILVLQGPSTSGKTTLARMLRALLDPATSPVCRTPRHQRDLLRLAWNNYVLVFDHATRLPAAIVDSLCRLSSGAGFAFDEMADGSDVLIRLQRPVILTLPEGEHLGHLRSRAFLVPLAAIPPHARRSEAELFTEFAAALPALLSRLCTAVSSALANASATTLESKPAFIDAATWAVAAAPSLGISAKEMETALTPDEFTRDLAAFIQETGGWEGTATALLAVLQSRAISGLPANANALARKIHHSPLASYNVECSPHRTRAGDRAFRLTVARQIVVKTARSA